MSRYIDADALIPKINECVNDHYITDFDAIATILDAPTIEPTEEFEWCHDCKEYDQDKHCCHRWSKQIRETVAELEEYYKPKRGEWKRRIVDNGFNADWVCSECGYRVKTDFVDYNFCPNCGADMRGKDDE